ncbi:hypothetical protein HN011_007029 [Eciton burchellii]|nr:hypothetical protein HN011_007029 [Eciton burchellii]
MSETSELSDIATSDKQDDKDADFNMDDYRHEIDSDDSSNEFPENNINNIEKDNSSNNRDTGPVISGHRFDKKLICVKYPGNVVNVDKAIETLGGISAISMTVDAPNRRLELRFRPDDGYCKPTCGDRHNTVGFLLRVRVKKNRVKQTEDVITKTVKPTSPEKATTSQIKDYDSDLAHCSADTISEEKCSKNNVDNENLSQDAEFEPRLKILGRVETEFKFTNLCDFQYVPMTQSKSDPKQLECIYSMIYPTGIPSYSWLKNDVPYFLPPATFSRMDTVQQYVPKMATDSNAENIIGKSKKCQGGFPNYIYFSTLNVPTTAPKGIEAAMRVKFLHKLHLEQVRRLFMERPIWSKNAIMHKTQFTYEQLKILLPSVAYYFMTGPWRIMWVKLGYDPRKDVNARKYQTLDYRLKAMHGLGSTVRCKRNYAHYTLPYKSTPVSKQKPAILTANLSQEQNPKKKRHLLENVYIYREGIVPPSRQMFYQYCDILVGEIQDMLAKLPDPMPGTKCHEKRGWLPNDFDVQCREIINKQVRAVLRKRMNIPEDHPTSLPRKRKRGVRTKTNKMVKKKTKRNSTQIQPDVTFPLKTECD